MTEAHLIGKDIFYIITKTELFGYGVTITAYERAGKGA